MQIRQIPICIISLLVGASGYAVDIAPDDENRIREDFQLAALDEQSGRVVLIDANGDSQVYLLDVESDDGIRLLGVAAGAALFEVRDSKSGDLVAYRVERGERLRVRVAAQAPRMSVRSFEITRDMSVDEPEKSPAAKE